MYQTKEKCVKKKTSNTKVSKQAPLKEPSKWNVFLMNDDESSMEFVVSILINIFSKETQIAKELMMQIHTDGKAICGSYTHEIALTKLAQVSSAAKNAGYPLRAVMREIVEE